MPQGCGHLASQFQRRGIIYVLPIFTKHCYILNAGFIPGGFKEDDFLSYSYYKHLADDAPWVWPN